MTTAKTDKIDRGKIITVVSARHNSNGQLRVEYGPLDIAWSSFDGGWVSVETSAGEVAFEVHEDESDSVDEEAAKKDQAPMEEEAEEEEEERVQTVKTAAVSEDAQGQGEPTHGFEVDSLTSLPILTSNRNKMDPAFGAPPPYLQHLVECCLCDDVDLRLWCKPFQAKTRTFLPVLSETELSSRLKRHLRSGHIGF